MVSMLSVGRAMARRVGSLLGRACGAAQGAGEKYSGLGDFRLTSEDEAPAIMDAGRRTPDAGRHLCVFMAPLLSVFMAPPPKRILLPA